MVLLLSWGQEADGMEIFSDEEVPTEDMIERMEERLETATSQQKNLFLIIFQVCDQSPPPPPIPHSHPIRINEKQHELKVKFKEKKASEWTLIKLTELWHQIL